MRLETDQENREIQKRLVKREGTTGGKLPWLDWRNGRSWRHLSQCIFLLINGYLGLTFYFWVKHYESFGASAYIARPSGVEGWLPLAGIMNLRYFSLTGDMPPIYAPAMLLMALFIVISILFRRSFCSWFCPVGSISELLWRLGKRLFKGVYKLPLWLDIPLRSLKYLLLVVILSILLPMGASAITSFLMSPYGVIIDVKMLDFFRKAGTATVISFVITGVLSLFIQNVWCRYLCPYGALVGIFSMLSPFKIRRDANACIDCNRCAQVCPLRLPVDRVIHIQSLECTTCLSCVEICPAQDALQLALRPKGDLAANGDKTSIAKRWKRRKVFGVTVFVILYLLLILLIGWAKYNDHWNTPVPDEIYQQYIPQADKFNHP